MSSTRWGYFYTWLARFGSDQSKSPFFLGGIFAIAQCASIYPNALLPLSPPLCGYKHVDVHVHTMVFFFLFFLLRYPRCQRKVRGSWENLYFIILFFPSSTLSFSVGRIISRRVSILYVYVSM